MITYIIKRLLLMIPTLLGVAVIIFFLMRIVPGDIVLVAHKSGEVRPMERETDGWFKCPYDHGDWGPESWAVEDVTHWQPMPLPPPPVVKGEAS